MKEMLDGFPALFTPSLLRVTSFSFVPHKSENFALGETNCPECIVSDGWLLSCALSCFTGQLDTQVAKNLPGTLTFVQIRYERESPAAAPEAVSI